MTKDAQRACENLGARALEVFILCLTVQIKYHHKRQLHRKGHYFSIMRSEKYPKGDRIGWSKVPILTQNFSSLNTARRQKGKEILDIHRSKLDMMPRTEKSLGW